MAKATPAPSAPIQTTTRSPFVGIAGAIGGTLIAIVAVIGIFVHEDAAPAIAVVAIAMAVLGIFLGYFALKRQ